MNSSAMMEEFGDPLLSAILATQSPPVAESVAVAILKDHYGLDATVQKVASERDEMFRVHEESGRKFILKVTNPAEPAEVTDFQTQALLWIADTDPTLRVPRVERTVQGRADLRLELQEAPRRTVRLFSFLEGRPLYDAPQNARQREKLGSISARLGRALFGFDHDYADYDLAWDIRHTDRLCPLLDFVENGRRRDLAENFMAQFKEIQPKLLKLRRQVVHNDLNLYNVLVSEDGLGDITGIFDFGDIVRTQLINDVAVGAAYHVGAAGDPMEGPADFVAAYHRSRPLHDDEIDILPALIAARLLVTVLITGWRADRHPEKKDYILKNNRSSWVGLAQLSQIGPLNMSQFFHSRCNNG